jgi:TfoX/Sxy family transcriptional regulator of competence genes
MAYDEQLAERIREALTDEPGITERLMFGGIAFMLNGNMTAGIVKDDLMVRVGADAYEDVLDLPHARVMDFNGRPLKGMVFVDKEGLVSDADLSAWLDYGLVFTRSLPAK